MHFVRIVCIVCWIGCALNCCWEFVIGCTVSYVVIRNVRFLVLSQDQDWDMQAIMGKGLIKYYDPVSSSLYPLANCSDGIF